MGVSQWMLPRTLGVEEFAVDYAGRLVDWWVGHLLFVG